MLRKDSQHPDLASRIRYILKEMEWTPSKLSREIGAGSPGAVGNWLNRNQAMDPSFAFALQDKHRWNARWLLEGVLPRRIEATDAEAEALFRQILDLPPDRRRAIALLLGTD